MNESLNPALIYRNAVRQLCLQYHLDPVVDQDDHFRSYLENQYKLEKEQLGFLLYSKAPANQSTSVRNGLFVLAVGLLAFGNLDMVDDILHNIPAAGEIRHLVFALKALLPLPENLDPQHDYDEMSKWISTNKAKLKWDEKKGKFLLK
jgi:hypothetical protein